MYLPLATQANGQGQFWVKGLPYSPEIFDPPDMYFGIEQEILEGRRRIKEQTVQRRQRQHQLETARAYKPINQSLIE